MRVRVRLHRQNLYIPSLAVTVGYLLGRGGKGNLTLYYYELNKQKYII